MNTQVYQPHWRQVEWLRQGDNDGQSANETSPAAARTGRAWWKGPLGWTGTLLTAAVTGFAPQINQALGFVLPSTTSVAPITTRVLTLRPGQATPL